MLKKILNAVVKQIKKDFTFPHIEYGNSSSPGYYKIWMGGDGHFYRQKWYGSYVIGPAERMSFTPEELNKSSPSYEGLEERVRYLSKRVMELEEKLKS